MSAASAAPAAAQSMTERLVAFTRSYWGVLLSALLWVLFLANFLAFNIPFGDDGVQYGFAQRLFGDIPKADGYYFGLGLAEAPFYGIGKLFEAAGLHDVAGHETRKVAVTIGLTLTTLALWLLLASVLRSLRLRYSGVVILAAALGTPFFFYAAFYPGKNHTLDTVLFTVVIYLTFRYFAGGDHPAAWLPFAIGGVLGFSYTVRYFSGAEGVMLVLLLLVWRRWRHAAEIALTSSVVCLLLWIVPTAYHVKVFQGAADPSTLIIFAPLNPLRMLFTNHRGYLVWSPIAALAIIGLILLFRRRPEHRRFLTAVTAMGVGIMASYSLIPYWDATWSFSQRFFVSLMPLVAIGLAGLFDVVPRIALVAATICVAWSLFLAFNLITIGGPQYLSTIPGGATDVALIPTRTHTSIGAYAWGVRHRARLIP